MEQKYEVGGFLEDANGVMHEIIEVMTWTANLKDWGWAYISHYKYHPPVKLIPMTRELQEALEECFTSYPPGQGDSTSAYFALFTAYQKAKEAAK